MDKLVRIFFAVDSADIVDYFYEKLRMKLFVLISYFVLRGNTIALTDEIKQMIKMLFLDSGAFSANKGLSKIDRDEYAKFRKRYWQLFDQDFNFDDKFDDPEHNFQNQLYIEEATPGIRRPIPVLHDANNPFEELKMYVDMGYDYVALGSGNKKNGNRVLEKVKTDYPDLKIHLFGRLELDILERFRPYSADGAHYAHVAKTGTILYWDEEAKTTHKIYVGGREKSPTEKGFEHFQPFLKSHAGFRNMIENIFGYTHCDLLTDYRKLQIINIYFYEMFAEHLNKIEK